MIRILAASLVALFLISCSSTLPRQELIQRAKAYKTITDAEWKDDCKYAEEEIIKLHPEPFWTTSKHDFDSSLNMFVEGKGHESSSERLVGLMKQLAMLEDAHTNVDLSYLPLNYLPIRLMNLSNGLCVVSAFETYKGMISGRVVKLNGVALDEVIAKIVPTFAHETDGWKWHCIESSINIMEILQGIGIAKEGDTTVEVSYIKTTDTSSVRVRCFNGSKIWKGPWVTIYQTAGVNPPISSLALPAKVPYWFSEFEAAKAIYFQYNQCREMPKQPFGAFTDSLFSVIKSKNVKYLIVDLRNNFGGDSKLFTANILPHIEKGGDGIKAIACFGRNTFSSGLWAAIEMVKADAATYGEETGNKCNHFGQPKQIMLPNSNIIINVSTKSWKLLSDCEAGLAPKNSIDITIDDLIAGKDPVLDAIARDIDNQAKE